MVIWIMQIPQSAQRWAESSVSKSSTSLGRKIGGFSFSRTRSIRSTHCAGEVGRSWGGYSPAKNAPCRWEWTLWVSPKSTTTVLPHLFQRPAPCREDTMAQECVSGGDHPVNPHGHQTVAGILISKHARGASATVNTLGSEMDQTGISRSDCMLAKRLPVSKTGYGTEGDSRRVMHPNLISSPRNVKQSPQLGNR